MGHLKGVWMSLHVQKDDLVETGDLPLNQILKHRWVHIEREVLWRTKWGPKFDMSSVHKRKDPGFSLY
jgi:hypothetical protein